MDEYNLRLMHLIDEKFSKPPFYGSRRMREVLKRGGYKVSKKRVQYLLKLMGG
ncbi:transposase [Candidatus Aerophobetes bacterium]|nr:transposase [Candidatus Aerophobetes bacterium]